MKRKITRTEDTISYSYAYMRGEKPISYWKKATVLQETYKNFKRMSKQALLIDSYRRFLRHMNMNEKQIVHALSKLKADVLRKQLLRYSGNHCTGDFNRLLYRHTDFYTLLDEKELLTVIKKLVKPAEAVQLKIRGITE